MINWKEVSENPEVMIKHKEDLKNERIFRDPWYHVFDRHPYLYREFSDRFDEMDGTDVAYALRDDPTLVLDLKNLLHKVSGGYFKWVLYLRPELSLCIKYKDDPDKVEAAYYIGYPHKLDDLNKEEKREMSERIMELLREEKV